jgi:hypothetical protein
MQIDESLFRADVLTMLLTRAPDFKRKNFCSKTSLQRSSRAHKNFNMKSDERAVTNMVAVMKTGAWDHLNATSKYVTSLNLYLYLNFFADFVLIVLCDKRAIAHIAYIYIYMRSICIFSRRLKLFGWLVDHELARRPRRDVTVGRSPSICSFMVSAFVVRMLDIEKVEGALVGL